RMTAPRQTTASWCLASSCATTGSSIAPATRTTSTLVTPQALAAATARSTRESVISACHRVAAIASARSPASTVASCGRPFPLIRFPRSSGDVGRRQLRPVQRLELVPEAVALGGEVAQVLRGGHPGQRYPGHAEAVRRQRVNLRRVVREQPHRADAQV